MLNETGKCQERKCTQLPRDSQSSKRSMHSTRPVPLPWTSARKRGLISSSDIGYMRHRSQVRPCSGDMPQTRMSHDTMGLLLKCSQPRHLGEWDHAPLVFSPFRIISILLVPRALDSRYEVNKQICSQDMQPRSMEHAMRRNTDIWNCGTATRLKRGNARHTCE